MFGALPEAAGRGKKGRREYQRQFNVKVAGSQKQKKSREEVYKERTDKSYGTGVGLMAGLQKRKKKEVNKSEKETKKSRTGCRCGSSTHQRTTHKDCTLKRSAMSRDLASTPLPALPPPQRHAIVSTATTAVGTTQLPLTALTDAPMKAPVTALHPPASTSIQFVALHQHEAYCIFTSTPAADGKKMRLESQTLLPLLPTYARQPASYGVHVRWHAQYFGSTYTYVMGTYNKGLTYESSSTTRALRLEYVS